MKRIIAITAAILLVSLAVLPALADGASANSLWIIEDSGTRRLTAAELWGYTRETLRYIRNEILARHGYAFQMAKFYNYFNAKPWYEAGGYGTVKTLSHLEWENITTVKSVERAMDRAGTQNLSGLSIDDIIAAQNSAGGYGNQRGYGNARGVGDGLTALESGNAGSGVSGPVTPTPNYIYTTQFIIPDSSTRALTEGELWAYSREALRYIRNEILARHGYAFGRNKFYNYFSGKLWYTAGGYDDATLSSLEWRNISLIKKVERAMDALGIQNSAYLDIATIIQHQNAGTCPGGQ